MQTFTSRVNARLPTERPDHILLAILQSYPDKTCTKPCPSGETSAPDGRCVPGAIAGIATKTAALSHAKSVPRVSRWSATETAAAADDDEALVYKLPQAASTTAVKPPPAPKIAAPPKQLPQRPMVTSASREQSRTLRSEREQSRTSQHSEFVRTFFQRLDGSGR